jgi:hypothetical protein
MDTNTTTDPAATLAAIIREVDGRHDLSADALACAILAHPASQWGPAAPWPELPENPPVIGPGSRSRNPCLDSAWLAGRLEGWHAARAELQRLREQAGVAPTPAPAIDYGHILSPEPGFELLPYDGDPEKLPRDAQQLGGKWWGPRFGSDSLAATLGAILERMVAATPCVVGQPMKDPNKTSRELYLSGDLIDELIKKGTRNALMSNAEELALALLKVLQAAKRPAS